MYPSNKWCSPRRYNNKVSLLYSLGLCREIWSTHYILQILFWYLVLQKVFSVSLANTVFDSAYLKVEKESREKEANVTVWKSVVRAIKLFLSATWVLLVFYVLLLCWTPELRERKEVSFAWKTPTFTAPRVCYRSRNKIRIL